MLERLKGTVRHTFIYSLGAIALKVVGVILLPLYTAKLLQQDFGNWDLIDITIQILGEILILGQASSIILLNNSSEYKEKKETTLFTLTTFLLITCGLLVIFAEGFVSLFPQIFKHSLIQAYYVRLSAYIVLLHVINNLFFAKLRADEQSVFFTIVSLIRILSTAGITIYFVAYLDMGIGGILYAAVIGEFLTITILLFKAIPQMQARFDYNILKVGLKFGLPLVVASAGFYLLNLSDRYIIKFLIGANANALYALGYRIAGLLNSLLIFPFTLGLLPIAYKYFGQPDDKRFYTKLMTYSTFFFTWGFVFLSLFSKEIVSIFSRKPEYESTFLVIPIILLSYVFSGMRSTAQLGMMLTKNTKHIAWITLGAAVLNIILNFILIPRYGIVAAAVNTLVSFIIFYFVTQVVSDKYYKIPYENTKLLLLISTGTVLSSLIYFLPSTDLFVDIILKLILTVSFPFLLFTFKFYEKAELEILTSPSKMLDLAKGIFKGAKETPVDAGTNIEQ